MATAAPASASARTIAAPMPREAPVTNAVRRRRFSVVMHVSGQNCTLVETITLPPPKPPYGWNGPCFRYLRLRALPIPDALEMVVTAGRASGGLEGFDGRRYRIRAEAKAALALCAGIEPDARIDLGGVERALPLLH